MNVADGTYLVLMVRLVKDDAFNGFSDGTGLCT